MPVPFGTAQCDVSVALLQWRELLTVEVAATLHVHDCPQPMIDQVHGYVLAGGLELATACDLVGSGSAPGTARGLVRKSKPERPGVTPLPYDERDAASADAVPVTSSRTPRSSEMAGLQPMAFRRDADRAESWTSPARTGRRMRPNTIPAARSTLSASAVIDVRRPAAMFQVPLGTSGIADPDKGIDHVGDVDEVARLASVTVDRQGLPGDGLADERRDHGAFESARLTRPVDVRWPRDRVGEPRQHDVALAGQLVNPVVRRRGCARCLRSRATRVAVDGSSGRHEDKPIGTR